MTNMTQKVALLLIGFNRLELLDKRLTELNDHRIGNLQLYVAIDGPRLGNSDDYEARKLILKKLEEEKRSSLFLISREDNLGCDLHIPTAIDEVLGFHESVIVIEDDVSMSVDSILGIAKQLVLESNIGQPNVAIGMSSITKLPFVCRNRWRKSKYFSAWGFGLNREFWNVHKQVLSQAGKSSQFDEIMKSSNSWKKLSKRKQKLWRERFQRGNYDYGIQQTLFAKDILTISPLLRVVSNEGHGDRLSTHTRFRKPLYLRARVSNLSHNFSGKALPSGFPYSSILDFLDSNTWAGDGLLSSRGRNLGFRSLLRILIERISKS